MNPQTVGALMLASILVVFLAFGVRDGVRVWGWKAFLIGAIKIIAVIAAILAWIGVAAYLMTMPRL